MASKPQEPPESIVIDQFDGIKNTVSEERLQPGELSRAVNIDIDDVGQIRRRRGQELKLAGDCHSLWRSAAGRTFVVKDGDLCLLNTNYTTLVVAAGVGPKPIAFTEVGDTIFYTSEDAAGKILSDNSRADWGVRDGSSTWLSPVIRPTETLGAISGKLLGPPPAATLLTAWNGRIYLAQGNVLWATELFMFDYVDKTKNYLQFETDITVLESVDDGIYVGTEDALFFLNGVFGAGLSRKHVTASPIIRGSAVRIPAEQTKVGAQGGQVGESVMVMSESGILACYAGGSVTNMTSGRVEFPSAENAAALHREDSGVSSYVSVARSGGGPATNARIGDYCDAEIRRATGS